MEFKDIVIFAVLVWSVLAYSFALCATYDLFKYDPPDNREDLLVCLLITTTAPIAIIVIMCCCSYERYKEKRDGPS